MAVEAGHVTPALGEASSGGSSVTTPLVLGSSADDTNKQLLVKSASDGSTTGNDPGQFVAEHIQPDSEGWRTFYTDWCVSAWKTLDAGATWTKGEFYYYAQLHTFDNGVVGPGFQITGGQGGTGWAQAIQAGATGARPSDAQTGQRYYDTTLSKPVWWSGSAWKDATGAAV